ncbi:lipopolysaccharide/colanic/teichoic acid biosynthesis glycosyltransferase [Neorhizobium galegae]|uniref:sugar transferase n=1 Tax=Neorhizobium galegae TaxID=399 RepID=UPI001AEB2560|nr:sugar transferase [Neorhizobium galegae]MBP2557994.1 lipopolysaccharide/colanic/teichoic acid biosynthesis glycosyltransferase [Neorhizobium galegae]MDQ0136784.1 lipopolysaccharide/colanic/teichoic acid biosynthesis glycosyltransferase [Neorhizobium galegae]
MSVPDLHSDTADGSSGGRYIEPPPVLVRHSGLPRKSRGSLRTQLAAKRAIDIGVSLCALILLLPLMLLVALAIRIDSDGPALFTQMRWGKGGRRFRVYKFRSMRTNLADARGIAQTVKDDPRLTRVGALIRKANVDELPQLLNVLKGDMSLVGPRCHVIDMLAAGIPYESLVSDYHRRHSMRPGMTGLAQMRGLRGPTDRPGKARARIACDLHYIDNFSILLDLRIMFGTLLAEFRGGKGF